MEWWIDVWNCKSSFALCHLNGLQRNPLLAIIQRHYSRTLKPELVTLIQDECADCRVLLCSRSTRCNDLYFCEIRFLRHCTKQVCDVIKLRSIRPQRSNKLVWYIIQYTLYRILQSLCYTRLGTDGCNLYWFVWANNCKIYFFLFFFQ